ncbi:Pecanex-like protein 1 [Pseudonocardia sp. ICBG1122]|nr:Pecanex-like protein 1 [Pseudonocardia pini]
MRSTTSRSRTIAVTALALGLLVAGPAAYAAGAASADRSDRPANVASGPSDPTGSSGGAGSSGFSGSPEGASGSGSSSGGGEHDHTGHTGSGSSDSGDGSGDGAGAGGGSADRGSGGAGDEPDAGDGEKKGAQSALDILAVDCSGSRLTAHDGFQKAPRCVSTAFGEVADADRSPSLLITQAPTTVRPGESFRLTVSTRNLVRDRFLPAAQGGYYAEASLLDGQGLQRGHFHTACRILPDPGEAPDSSPDPLFFQATEDGGGGAQPDSVTIDVPGVEQTGELQCSSWAGDGSHRTPMMQRANQTPAFDSVRIEVG